MAKDTFYFSHDYHARDDRKITDMMWDYGVAGYGSYWVVVELLAEEEEHKLMNDRTTWRAISKATGLEVEKVEKFINDCINEFELFETDGDFFWAERLLRHFEEREKKSKTNKNSANKRWEKYREQKEQNANALQENANAMQNNAKEIKEKKKKEKENIVYKEFNGINTVKITEQCYSELTEVYDKDYVYTVILKMESWLVEKNKKYKNYDLQLRKWIDRDGDKAVKKKNKIDYTPYQQSEPSEEFKDW